ncbi:MAG: YceI family protein [Mariprofundales bacterium]
MRLIQAMKLKIKAVSIAATLVLLACTIPSNLVAEEQYVIDTKGMHAFIQFKVSHLGFSWELGRFNKFTGNFSYDEKNQANNSVSVEIDVASLDTNHAERDKHLRGDGYFDVAKFPNATFVTTSYTDKGNGVGILKGKLTLRGITKNITIDVKQLGVGKDHWGGFRRGFEGSTILHLSDYNMEKGKILLPASENIEMFFSFEGIRQ